MLWKWGDLRQSNYFPPLSSEKSQICQLDCLSLKALKKKKKKLSLSRSPYKQNGTCVVKELLESSFEEIYIFTLLYLWNQMVFLLFNIRVQE